MFHKYLHAVMAIGSSAVQKSKEMYHGFLNKVRGMFQKPCALVKRTYEKAIEGEYLGKGATVFIGAGSLAFAGNALADVPAGVTTAITTAATDVATIGAAVILVMIGIKVWKWLMRAL